MSAGLAALRENYAEQRRKLLEEFARDRDPQAALSGLTDAADDLIRRVARSHKCDHDVCLIAIGGYGRRELYPFSDIDLLFLYPDAAQEEAEKAITRVLHDLWDSKLHLGHQVWSLSSLEGLALPDFEFILALTNGRLVAGDEKLGREALAGILPSFLRAHSEELTAKIIEVTEKRHSSYRNTIYQLEPDLKQAPGGLRDYLAAKWLCALGVASPDPSSEPDVEKAHGVLARFRTMLHSLRGRQQNQLTHRMQEEIARKSGYSEVSLQAGVESLMMEYFLHARILHSFCLRAIRSAKGPAARVAELDLDPEAPLENARELLDVFLRSLEDNRVLSDRTRSRIADALPVVSQTVSFPELGSRVKKLFKPRPGLYRALTDMYETGLLELLFPEFGSIKARVVRDFYHKYTVDEHSLLTIKNIENLLTTTERSDLRFRSLLLESEDAELLTIALLLHDVGKSREGTHVDRGTSMAAKALRRFQIAREEFETILFLIRNHLAMSSVVFRRDLDDPEVARRFVDLVNDPGRLRLLTLMTYADIKAVAPGTLNDWKKDLLWQLYVAAYNKLTLGFGEERIEEEDVGEKLLLDLPAELDGDNFERFLEGFPRRYLMTVPPPEIYEHFRLASALSAENPVQLRLTGRDGYYELCAVTPDRYYLFAKIVGLLSYFEMNILRGYGFSNRQNTVLDLFHFHDTREVFALNPEEKSRFLQLLRQAVGDQISVERVLAGKEQSVVFRPVGPSFPPTIHFEDEFSDSYSIMEIVAPDSMGLLYRIGREISKLRCNIELVLIATEGNKAVDVFYLTYEGKKLPLDLKQGLKASIAGAIG
ncbi:MAG: HD domain-containing protein [Acidobacteria bacterium]|nr:MAG: HD domain-containing protein [Acidobacteriota bacterium]